MKSKHQLVAAACAALSGGAIALAARQGLRDRQTTKRNARGLAGLQLRYLAVYGLAIAGAFRIDQIVLKFSLTHV